MKLTAVVRKNLPEIKENIFCYYILKPICKRPVTESPVFVFSRISLNKKKFFREGFLW